MKTAIEKLRELREQDSSIVAIAKDKDNKVFAYKFDNPEKSSVYWTNLSQRGVGYFELFYEVEFSESDWTKCIVTYKDVETFDIETITISKSEYDRLLACESKLNEIMKILEK